MTHIITPEPLTIAAFAPYGQAVLGATGQANYTGEGWESQFPAGDAHLPQAQLGWVTLQSSLAEITLPGMEREPELEMIWTVDKPIIQTVALPGNVSDHSQQPQVENVKAFIVLPGQVIIMHPGTWHYAAIPVSDAPTLYYFITKDHPREPGWEQVAWVPFVGDQAVVVKKES